MYPSSAFFRRFRFQSVTFSLSLRFSLSFSPFIYPSVVLHICLFLSACLLCFSLSLCVCQLVMTNVHIKTPYGFLINYLMTITPNGSVWATKALPRGCFCTCKNWAPLMIAVAEGIITGLYDLNYAKCSQASSGFSEEIDSELWQVALYQTCTDWYSNGRVHEGRTNRLLRHHHITIISMVLWVNINIVCVFVCVSQAGSEWEEGCLSCRCVNGKKLCQLRCPPLLCVEVRRRHSVLNWHLSDCVLCFFYWLLCLLISAYMGRQWSLTLEVSKDFFPRSYIQRHYCMGG